MFEELDLKIDTEEKPVSPAIGSYYTFVFKACNPTVICTWDGHICQ